MIGAGGYRTFYFDVQDSASNYDSFSLEFLEARPWEMNSYGTFEPTHAINFEVQSQTDEEWEWAYEDSDSDNEEMRWSIGSITVEYDSYAAKLGLASSLIALTQLFI